MHCRRGAHQPGAHPRYCAPGNLLGTADGRFTTCPTGATHILCTSSRRGGYCAWTGKDHHTSPILCTEEHHPLQPRYTCLVSGRRSARLPATRRVAGPGPQTPSLTAPWDRYQHPSRASQPVYAMLLVDVLMYIRRALHHVQAGPSEPRCKCAGLIAPVSPAHRPRHQDDVGHQLHAPSAPAQKRAGTYPTPRAG